MQREPSSWSQLVRRLEVRAALWVLSADGVIGSILIITVLEAHTADKMPWDWLKALVLPLVIAALGTFGGAWFTRERARDTALQTYLDKMSELLIDKGLRRETRRYGDTRVTARARTLAVLSQLDGDRKRIVLQFLREARLINKDQTILEGVTINACLVGLRDADLSNADLQDLRLISSDRTEAVSLEGAILQEANLRNVDLEGADLREADLRGADLQGAYLKSADLRGVNLAKATLEGTNLRRAKFGVYTRKDKRNEQTLKRATNLAGANLTRADLTGAIELMEDGQEQEITRKWLGERTHLLTDATVSEGPKHP
jgi:uncharacterized protein YjbI with pentapeptide repeats